jgi:hypothetical protein
VLLPPPDALQASLAHQAGHPVTADHDPLAVQLAQSLRAP